MSPVPTLSKWFFRSAACLLCVVICAQSLSSAAEEPAKQPETTSSPAQSKKDKQEQGFKNQPGIGAQLARQAREAAGEEDEGQFKQSASVRWLAQVTSLDLKHAYWLAVVLNFVVVAGLLVWVGRKYLPRILRARTESIQRAMEEARRAGEEANRRLAEIEARLSRLGDEIATLKAAGDQEMAAEEARVKAAADEDARKIVESAEQEIAAAAKAARRDLTAYAADLALALAKKQIHVDAGTDASLVRSFTQRLAGGGPEKGN